jgi:dsDNA-binding SOS-regulon protein
VNLKELKRKIIKQEDGTNNYVNVSIEEMDWLLAQVENWEKAYWYFKESLESCSYIDHHRCTESVELEQLNDLTMLMDSLWEEKIESISKEEKCRNTGKGEASLDYKKMLGYARDLRSDINYALTNSDEVVVSEKDEKLIVWLIEQAKRAEMYKLALMEIGSNKFMSNESRIANQALLKADLEFNA